MQWRELRFTPRVSKWINIDDIFYKKNIICWTNYLMITRYYLISYNSRSLGQLIYNLVNVLNFNLKQIKLECQLHLFIKNPKQLKLVKDRTVLKQIYLLYITDLLKIKTIFNVSSES